MSSLLNTDLKKVVLIILFKCFWGSSADMIKLLKSLYTRKD